MQWIKQIKQIIREGIYIKNLNLIVTAASKGLEAGRFIVPAFVIREVADSVISLWDDRVVRSPERSLVEEGLRSAFDALLDAMLNDAPQSEIIAATEALIVAWQSIQKEVRDLADLTEE